MTGASSGKTDPGRSAAAHLPTGSRRRTGVLLRAAPLVLILVAPAVMLYSIWADPLSAAEDDVVYVYPLRKMVGQALRKGRWPVWNALEAAGSPLMADPQSAVMFPPTWLFAAIDGRTAFSLSIFLAFSTAGCGAYLYLRLLALSRPAATLGAVAFMFSGFMIGHRVHLPMIQTAAFLPWGLWGMEVARRRRLAGLMALAATFFLALAAGHWAILTFMAVAWLAYLLLRCRPLLPALAIAAGAAVLALAIAAPQVGATASLLGQATRRDIGYATVGENSFFPTCVVLALFPMLMGNTTPNFYPQRWWGPWHLWEMLGYVGLVTMALAAAAVWSLYRKGRRQGQSAPGEAELTPLVRTWTWMGVGAGIWMLGYYLPTYELVHMVPVLGVVRCPGRMMLVADLALAVLAAAAVHAVSASAGQAPALARLRRAVLLAATAVLPAAMVVALALTAGVAVAVMAWPGKIPLPFAGGARDALAAVRPGNPAVYVPLILALATALAVRFWLTRPRRRSPILVGLLLVDLFFVAGFLDVRGKPRGGADRLASPAAEWLAANAPKEPYVVFGLNTDYRDRPAELLQPKTAQALGIATLGSYGAWHSPAHAHMLGFDNYGRCREWAWLVRRNYLLSLYGVRYLVAAGSESRDVIESVRIAAEEALGPNLLSGEWQLDGCTLGRDGSLSLRTPFLWRLSQARQDVQLQGGEVCRIVLDARGPDRGAGNFLRAEVFWILPGGRLLQDDQFGLTVIPERIAPHWRHFEWTFQTPAELPGPAVFRVFTMSERPIEVRNVQLRRSGWETPVDPFNRLADGEQVYRKVAEVAPVRPGDRPAAIYQNRLCQGAGERPRRGPADEDLIEGVRWMTGEGGGSTAPAGVAPELSLRAGIAPQGLFGMVTLPALGVFAVLAIVAAVRERKQASGA